MDSSNRPVVVPALIWPAIAQVPTNSTGFSQIIHCGSRRNPTAPVYNVVALRLPVSAHPGQMKLLQSGFVNGIRGQSDEIYTMNTATKGLLQGSTIYCDTNEVWRYVTTDELVPWDYFRPNDVIVIVSKNGGLGTSWTWTYQPTDFYTLPTRWMGWSTAPGLEPLAAEPTVHSSGLTFPTVFASQMQLSWTSGNGARRIVVGRPGTVTTWMPADGVAPAGVSTNFLEAADQGDGNRICYDGPGNTFRLVGLTANTPYSFKVIEYNGTGAGVNYFATGTPLTGNQNTGN